MRDPHFTTKAGVPLLKTYLKESSAHVRRDLAASHLSVRGEDVCIWLPSFAEVEGFLKTQFGMAAQATVPLLHLSWLILFCW